MIPDKFLSVVTNESSRTRNDLNELEPDKALIKFYARHDQVVTAVLTHSDKNIACQAGCSYCCYFKIEVKPLEIIAIADHLKKTFPPEKIDAVVKKAKDNIAEFDQLDYSQQVSTNQPCPFLLEDQCSIYNLRPTKCRNAHAMDASLCQACFDNPADTSIPSSYHKQLHLAVNGLTRGFESALEEQNYDTDAYDINAIFIAAFENPKFKKRFIKGKKTLIK